MAHDRCIWLDLFYGEREIDATRTFICELSHAKFVRDLR